MNASGVRPRTITAVQMGVILLALSTASIHLYLGLSRQVDVGFGRGIVPIFPLNALGYLTLVTALYFPLPMLERFRRSLRGVLLGYTVLTVLLWALGGPRVAIAYADKTLELLLIALLLLDGRSGRKRVHSQDLQGT